MTLTENLIFPHTGELLQASGWSDDYLISPLGSVHYRKAASLNYDENYFLTDYKNQYGISYIEDEENLRKTARRRLNILKKSDLLDLHGKSILEIGSAAGFFLDEARKEGLLTEGIEISDFASEYAVKHLGLNVHNADFFSYTESRLNSGAVYDVIAAFFVIEHFSDQKKIFQYISRLLKPNGIFLFALPSINGPVFQCDIQKWIESHPQDHFADYSPKSLKRILPLYKMNLRQIYPSSYHQERACGLKKIFLNKSLYKNICDLTGYGDTMEGTAVKL
jgi:2-polyprenyl-3-methyl-5-hydroxy-6-metoxy-1,4-benzoquinol methylase